MESIISHEECLGFDASFGACFVGDYTFCIRAGNFLQINRFKDRAIDQLGLINGELYGFSAMAGDPLTHTLAYADIVRNPLIHFADNNGAEIGTISISGVLGIKSLSFSYDGQWLYSLGGLPSFRLSAIDMKTKEEVYNMTFDLPIGERLSVCPSKSRVFAVYGDSKLNIPLLPGELSNEKKIHLRFYTLLGASAHYAFSEVISDIPDPIISLCWSPQEECVVSTSTGKIYFVDPLTGLLTRDVYSMESLGEGEQNAVAIYCTFKYLITSGSSGNLYWIDLGNLEKKENMFILDTRAPLAFEYILPGTNSLFFATQKNMLSCIDLDQETHLYVDESWINLRDTHRGPITSAVALARHLITAGKDGSLRFWSFNPYLGLVQTFSFGTDGLTTLASSPGGYLVAVGSESGVVRIINTVDPQQPILLFRERLHKGSVSSITISREYIVSSSNDGSVVILRADPKNSFPLIGLLKLKSRVVSVATPAPLGKSQQVFIATAHREVIRIDIPENPAENFTISFENLNRAMLKVSNKISAICTEPSLREDQQYFYCACDDKTVKYYCMPITTGDLDIVGADDIEASAPDDVFTGHAKAVTSVALSPTQQYVASGCAGATLIVRELDVQTAQVINNLLNVTHHDPLNGAISSIAFSLDGKKMFSVGYDGCINMYSFKIQANPIPTDPYEMPQGCFKISTSRIFLIDQQINSLKEVWEKREYDISDEDGFQADDNAGCEEIPLIDQIKSENEKKQREETEKFQENLLSQLKKIHDEFMDLVNENEKASELERLNKSDFTLDVAAAEKLQQMGQIKSQLVLYRRRIKNQIRSLISQAITAKCYSIYEPKLTTIYGFKIPISFDNFPLPVQSEKKKRYYKCVTLLRRTEIAALRYKPAANDPNRIAPSMMRDNALDGARYLSSRSNSLVTLTATESEQEIIVKDDLKLLYDPFQIVTGNRKITQLTVVGNLIFEQMNKFNITFEELLVKKQNLVASLEEKNKRIRQLIRLLKLNEKDYVIFDPVPQDNEVADSFLSVKDEEVVLKKRIDSQNNQQEATDELEKDSFAERALRTMMGGNVNMNSLEEAPADDEPVRPEWMDTKKKEELTEEEQYQIQEFDKKLKNFIEEREKRRKALNAELTKLVKGNITLIEEFDRQMCLNYMIRFDCEEKVFYHELEIMHLVESLSDERSHRKELNDIAELSLQKMTEQKQLKPVLTELSNQSTQLAEESNNSEQNLENLKSQVNKEFHNRECINQLMRLYNTVAKRIRPQIENSPNPYKQFRANPFVFKDDLTEVQNSHPSSLADAPWKNFLEYCERKITYSKDSAEKASMSAEMKARVKKFENEINSIDELLKEMKDKQSKLSDKLLHTLVDMHIPFTFRQGQVEIPSDIVRIDYSDVLLIDKKVVIDRNNLILDAGHRKLDELENIKKQHTNHKMLKWEIDKCKVDLQNLEELFKEYQLFRVKKEDMYLIKGGEKNKNQDTVNQLNKGLEHMQRTHVVRLARAKADLKKLKRKVVRKKKENDKIEEEILQMQLGLKERKRIYNIQMISSKGAAEARKNRLKQVMMISRLKRAKQVQEQKIAELKDDVVKLRKCVYTSFNDGEDLDGMVGYTP